MRRLAALVVPLLLLASAARAADASPWGQTVDGKSWAAASLVKGPVKAKCWVSIGALAAAGDKDAVPMFQLALLGQQGDLKVYASKPCPIDGITKMGSGADGMLMLGSAGVTLAPGAAGRVMVLAQDHAADFQSRIKPSWDAMKRFAP